jgi:hypothetical protein
MNSISIAPNEQPPLAHDVLGAALQRRRHDEQHPDSVPDAGYPAQRYVPLTCDSHVSIGTTKQPATHPDGFEAAVHPAS